MLVPFQFNFPVFNMYKKSVLGWGGGNLMGSTCRDVPLFRGTFFPKNAEFWVSVFKLCAELWVPFWKKNAKSSRGTLRSNKMNVQLEIYRSNKMNV